MKITHNVHCVMYQKLKNISMKKKFSIFNSEIYTDKIQLAEIYFGNFERKAVNFIYCIRFSLEKMRVVESILFVLKIRNNRPAESR